jgi:hypothetical protein
MFEITSQPGDDSAFVEIVSRFVDYAVTKYELSVVFSIRVDHWFGERWLGFRGKILGALGVRNRSLNDDLVVPPFHPHRVKSVTRFDRLESGAFASMHIPAMTNYALGWGGENIGNYFRESGIYCWYAGDSGTTTSASLMVYVISPAGNSAWYVSFNKKDDWVLSKSIPMSAAECHFIIDEQTAPNAT